MKLTKLISYLFIFLSLGLNEVCLAESKLDEQHMKVVVRMVGHEFLLQLGDSTSRVLPIEFNDDTYSFQFERELEFEPDLLSFAAFKIFDANNITNGYILEVETCDENELVYIYEVNPDNENDLIPCKSRPLPKGCYQFCFTFLDKKEQLTAVVQETTERDELYIYIYGLIGLVVIGSMIYYLTRKKRPKEISEHIITIGKYQFDKKGMKLIFEDFDEELSSKEADLLELLVTNENKTLERDYILQVVWNDVGDYIGRTLDVSISKLRKKLQADTSLKIINIRGVGYRFTIT